jgi:lysophospholipase L1-like esterase
LGINFVELIKQKFPNLNCHNEGKGGETLIEIASRLKKILKENKKDYSTLIIEAGHNDIILPYVKLKWPVMSVKWVTPISQIGIVLDDMLSSVKSLTNAKIILTTLSCLGEVFESPLNRQRRLINEQIKLIGYRYDAYIADVSSAFDEIIMKSNSSGYLFNSLINLMIDFFRSRKTKWADKTSEKRKLTLTIDGGHLNSRGAKIYCREISRVLDKII